MGALKGPRPHGGVVPPQVLTRMGARGGLSPQGGREGTLALLAPSHGPPRPTTDGPQTLPHPCEGVGTIGPLPSVPSWYSLGGWKGGGDWPRCRHALVGVRLRRAPGCAAGRCAWCWALWGHEMEGVPPTAGALAAGLWGWAWSWRLQRGGYWWPADGLAGCVWARCVDLSTHYPQARFSPLPLDWAYQSGTLPA